jgi:hypothetical protein
MADSLITPVSVVESVGLKFVILDAPNDSNVHVYLEALKRENVGHVVRVCDPSYDTSSLLDNNIAVHVRVIIFSRTRFFPVVLLSKENHYTDRIPVHVSLMDAMVDSCVEGFTH